MLENAALFRPRERSFKSLLKYDSVLAGQFKGTSKGQQKRPFPLAVAAMYAHVAMNITVCARH